jgi:hypothetical protein
VVKLRGALRQLCQSSAESRLWEVDSATVPYLPLDLVKVARQVVETRIAVIKERSLYIFRSPLGGYADSVKFTAHVSGLTASPNAIDVIPKDEPRFRLSP